MARDYYTTSELAELSQYSPRRLRELAPKFDWAYQRCPRGDWLFKKEYAEIWIKEILQKKKKQ